MLIALLTDGDGIDYNYRHQFTALIVKAAC